MCSKERGRRCARSYALRERENLTVIACCRADGQFLPPALILKGYNKKQEFGDRLLIDRKRT
jgi:hypothetical protein